MIQKIQVFSWSGGVRGGELSPLTAEINRTDYLQQVIILLGDLWPWQSCGSTWLKSSTKTPHKPQQPTPPTHGPNDTGPTTGQCVLPDPKLLKNILKNVMS